jgi:hypothetical protein
MLFDDPAWWAGSANGTQWYAMVVDVENNIVVAEAKAMSTAKEA